MRRLSLILCGWLAAAAANAQTPPDTSRPDRIAELIGRLGAARFPIREAAARDLAALGRPALDALDRTAAGSRDPEVGERARQLARDIRGRSPGVLRIAGYDYDLPSWWEEVEVKVPAGLKDEQAVCNLVGSRYGQWEGTTATWQKALKAHAVADERAGLFPVWVAHCHMTGEDYARAARVYGDLCDRADTQGKDADWYRAYLGYKAGLLLVK